MASPHSNRKETKTEVGTGDWNIAVTGQQLCWVLEKYERCWDFGLEKWWDTELGHPSKTLEDSSAESYVDCGSPAQEL